MRPREREGKDMDSQTVIAAAERCAAAYQRGYERGLADNESKYYCECPLSGEWAGESSVELLGDLFHLAERDWFAERGMDHESSLAWSEVSDMYESRTEIEEHYERGYRAAFHDDDIVLCVGCETLIHRDHIGASFVDSGERDYYCSDYCAK
jgi:hypothetical protein